MDSSRRLAGSVRPHPQGWAAVVVPPGDGGEPARIEGKQLGPTQDEACAAAKRLGWSGPFHWERQDDGSFDLTAQLDAS